MTVHLAQLLANEDALLTKTFILRQEVPPEAAEMEKRW